MSHQPFSNSPLSPVDIEWHAARQHKWMHMVLIKSKCYLRARKFKSMMTTHKEQKSKYDKEIIALIARIKVARHLHRQANNSKITLLHFSSFG